MVSTYSDLDKVCKALGLKQKPTKSGYLWRGLINSNMVRISVHKHSEGRDIPNGTMRTYVKQLGFKSEKEYFDYLRTI